MECYNMKTFTRGMDPKESMDIGIYNTWISKISDIIIEVIGDPEDRITLNTNFKDDLNIDSLDAVELIMKMEKEFGIDILDEDADKVKTVRDVIDYLICKKAI